MYILGISCWYHDAAACLLKDGRIAACSEEERFSRKKHDFEFPVNAINFCLEEAGITSKDIEYVVFYDKPIRKFDRILTSVIQNIPKSLKLFYLAVPLWLKEKLQFKRKIKKQLGIDADKVLFASHHSSHEASTFFLSPFSEAAILTVDGVGEWATASLGIGKENNIMLFEEMRFPHSVGLLYSAFTAFLGFEINDGEYKVMGLAPYGEPKYKDKVYKVVELNEDGSIKLNLEYFSFTYSTDATYTDKFLDIFGEPRDPKSLFFTEKSGYFSYYGQKPENYIEQQKKNQYYADIAASIQDVLEEILVKMAKYLYQKTKSKNLCYAGGVALNSKANYRLMKESGFENIYIQPASTDAGGAIGAALWAWCQVLKNKRVEVMEHAYYGKEYGEQEIVDAIKENNLKYKKIDDEQLIDEVSGLLSKGNVIGWYQGRTEWGPRALGNRSILADARNPKMKDIVNTKVKFREPFRPFAPSVLDTSVADYFEVDKESYVQRFMLMTYPVKKEMQKVIPAVTHEDGTSRIQSVIKQYNPRYYKLIEKFKEKTGVGVVLNTSFNLKGEPIVNSPGNAIKTYLNSGIDLLILGNYIVYK
ncbi:MAG: carbamoyltransferase [Elusimicrobia bacterium]|nr:carbamoyltransferase [Candidatus Liberimonas magnetica]